MANPLTRALAGSAVAGAIFLWSLARFRRAKAFSSLLQLCGASGLLVVGGAHVCEALHLLPWMGWGLERSPGHYLDLLGALLGLVLIPASYIARKTSR